MASNDGSEPLVQLRRIGEGSGTAFCWQDKRALDTIRARLDGQTLQSAALMVYVALTEIASDEQSQVFTASQRWIALKSCTSAATVKRVLPHLEASGMVHIRGFALKAPCEFSLLQIAQVELTKALPEPTIAQSPNKASRATVEESTSHLINRKVGQNGTCTFSGTV